MRATGGSADAEPSSMHSIQEPSGMQKPSGSAPSFRLEIFLVSLATIVLEISMTLAMSRIPLPPPAGPSAEDG